jgi:hypothetical protein
MEREVRVRDCRKESTLLGSYSVRTVILFAPPYLLVCERQHHILGVMVGCLTCWQLGRCGKYHEEGP